MKCCFKTLAFAAEPQFLQVGHHTFRIMQEIFISDNGNPVSSIIHGNASSIKILLVQVQDVRIFLCVSHF